MTTAAYPAVDESRDRLHRSGWSLGEVCIVGGDGGRPWAVFGANGENLLDVRGASQSEAWWRACEAARAVGMLRSHP